MAVLDNGQKGTMFSDAEFLKRIAFAATGTAKYWVELPTGTMDTMTVETQKKKRLGKTILEGATINVQNYARIFLSYYEEDPPEVYNNGPYKGQLTDEVLNSSSAAFKTYAYVAGVQPGDETNKNIIW